MRGISRGGVVDLVMNELESYESFKCRFISSRGWNGRQRWPDIGDENNANESFSRCLSARELMLST